MKEMKEEVDQILLAEDGAGSPPMDIGAIYRDPKGKGKAKGKPAARTKVVRGKVVGNNAPRGTPGDLKHTPADGVATRDPAAHGNLAA